MKRNVIQYTGYLLSAILVLALISMCQNKNSFLKEVEAIKSYKDTVMYYKSLSGKSVAYNEALNVSYEALAHEKRELVKEIEDLRIKKPSVATKIIQEVKIDTLYIPFDTVIPCPEFKMNFTYDDSWLGIDGVVVNNGVSFDNIKLRNDMMIVVGTKKNGLFKKSDYIVAVNSDNPYFQIAGLQSYTFKTSPKWYNTWWFKLVLVGGAFGLGTQVNK